MIQSGRKIVAFIALVLVAAYSNIIFAYDIIVMNNGDLINAKVEEVGPSEIKYRKASNPNGPLYKIETKTVLAINYENGEKDTFGNVRPASVQSSSDSGLIPAVAAPDNDELVSRYNRDRPELLRKKPKDKIVEDGIAYWGMSDSTILSTPELTVSFENRRNEKYFIGNHDYSLSVDGFEGAYKVCLTNKTNYPIYVDLASCFKSIDGKGATWYDDKVISTNSGGQSGGSLNLGAVTSALGIGGIVGTLAGGIGVGKSNSSGVSTSESMQRILTVPPRSTVTLPGEKSVVDKDVVERFEFPWFIKRNFKEKVGMKKYVFTDFDQHDTPMKKDYYITYSTTPEFRTYFTLPIHLYIRTVVGCEFSPIYRQDDVGKHEPEYLIHSWVRFTKD